MKEIYQFYEAKSGDWEGLNVVCVCLLMDGDCVARGVSICSPGDAPDDEKGKIEANRRALRAIKGRGNTKISDRRAIVVLLRTECPFTHHAELNPKLTWQERRQLFGYKGMWRYERKMDLFAAVAGAVTEVRIEAGQVLGIIRP